MPYFGKLAGEFNRLTMWLDVKHEQGAKVGEIERELSRAINAASNKVQKLKPSAKFDEPNSLAAIQKARPKGPRVIDLDLTDEQLYDKMLGAWLGRSAGCMLGIPVEGKPRAWIEGWAKKLGQNYPLSDYFKDWAGISGMHYAEPMEHFVKPNIDHVGMDDDLVYTVLGLLILEEYGIDFTMEDVGKAWMKYLPMACTAERVALDNLKAGMKPPRTATVNNPYYEWIGADIRSDPWGYCAPGAPELAADFAWRDASVSHVKNGIYGEMYFSTAIAAAFVTDDMKKVLKIAATEIPAKCRMAKTVKQTIRWCETDGDWGKTHDRVMKEYEGMHPVHTLNNAALTIMGLLYGEMDFEKTIAYTVMAGLDTDCTGATAGSIIGAMLGAKKLPKKWIRPLGDRLTTYLIGEEEQSVTKLAKRCCKVAKKARKSVES